MRAFRSTVVRLVLFYLLTLALMLAIVPVDGGRRHESPFVKVMRALGVPAAAGIVNFVILIAALSAMNSQLYITTRMMFSLARAGHRAAASRHAEPPRACRSHRSCSRAWDRARDRAERARAGEIASSSWWRCLPSERCLPG